VQGTKEEASGEFLNIRNKTGTTPELHFEFYDEHCKLLYSRVKMPDNYWRI